LLVFDDCVPVQKIPSLEEWLAIYAGTMLLWIGKMLSLLRIQQELGCLPKMIEPKWILPGTTNCVDEDARNIQEVECDTSKQKESQDSRYCTL